MTQCTQEVFSFAAHFSRRVEASFTAGQVSSDGGALLLRQADRKIRLLERVASCFTDRRSPLLVEHRLGEMLSQRIYGLALGYEDLNDHEQLRHDPLMGVLAGRRKPEEPLAGKSTLNRLELPGGSKRYHKIDYEPEKIDALLLEVFIESHAQQPEQIVLDLDATDIPLYGHQPERFFHGYYDSYCYLPLYIFAGDQLLCARLRASNVDGAAGALDEVKRIVARLRAKWPKVRIVLRGDSGFCREELMAWCEANRVDFLFGLAGNSRLVGEIDAELAQAEAESRRTGKPARRFKDFTYATLKTWSRRRRVVGKAEWTNSEANPRFVVTTLKPIEQSARELYEDVYCARGDMENRIKESQADLFADRTSTATMMANQLRLWFSSFAYVLVCAVRRIGLRHTQFAEASAGTIRLKLFKIGALVKVSARRIKFALPTGCSYANEWRLAACYLARAAPV